MLLAFPVALAASITPLPKPHNLAPARWVVVGPYANPYGSDTGEKVLLEDLLLGEATLRLVSGITVKERIAKEVASDDATGVDFNEAFGGGPFSDTVAYAYCEVPAPDERDLFADFGSDDGARVWLNGVEIHRHIGPRGVDLDSDHFNAHLQKGVNRFVVKVESGNGGWGFAMRLMDAESRVAAKRRALRANLLERDLGPEEGGFLLTNRFPNIVWRRADASLVLAAKPLKVRWFGPDLQEATAPSADGRYFAYVESETIDGYTYKRILTFAKGPEYFGGMWPLPPFTDTPMLFRQDEMGYDTPPYNEAQRKEITRHALYATDNYLTRTEGGAILTGAMLDLQNVPSPPQPAWLYSGFVRNNEILRRAQGWE